MISQREDAVRHYRPIERLVPAHWQSGSVTTGDKAQLFYHRTGGDRKPPVVMLHGFQSAGLSWLRTARVLEANYDLIMPDFRGHGGSSGSVHGFGLERLTEDTAELINTLSLERPFVAGHSLGAEIAGRLAAAYPDLVRAVVLVDPPMRVFSSPPALRNSDWFKQWFATLQAIKSQSHEQRLITTLNLLPPGAPVWGEEDYVPFAEAQAQFNLDVLDHATIMNYAVATPEIADRIRIPLLLLTGNSQLGSGASSEGIAMLAGKGAEREAISFESAGHFIPIDQFDEFITVLSDFFRRH